VTAVADFPQKLGMEVRVTDRLHRVSRRSKNLRAVLEHARKHVVTVVEVRQVGEYYGVAFHFEGGDTALTCWSDWRVLADWLKARRSWGPDRISLDFEADGILDRFRAASQGTWVHYRTAGR
jgi:hypothetical protein